MNQSEGKLILEDWSNEHGNTQARLFIIAYRMLQGDTRWEATRIACESYPKNLKCARNQSLNFIKTVRSEASLPPKKDVPDVWVNAYHKVATA